jgi:tRNA (guanine-N7-)-methyltransferase
VETFRKITSFVKRCGRITKSQSDAIKNLSSKYLLSPYTLNNKESSAENNQKDSEKEEQKTFAFLSPEIFCKIQPIILEIGFGNGDSLIKMAICNPDKNYLGIEVHTPGVGRILANIEKNSLTNLKVITHDAVEILSNCLPNDFLHGVQIFFPDPWHKKRHHKRRLIQTSFIKMLYKKMDDNAFLHIATDWENYAEHIQEVLEASSSLFSTHKNALSISDLRPITKFENRGIRLEHKIFDLVYQKVN